MRLSRIFLFVPALMLACAVTAFFFALPLLQPPRVVSIEPANGTREVLPASPITITFSAPMHREVTQNAIRISPRVIGEWAWQNNETVVFTPRDTLPISKTLTVQVSQAARSLLQQTLTQEARARFTTLAFPHVVASAPARDAQFVYVPNPVTLTFNRALNQNALRENLIITPTLTNQKIIADGATVTLRGFFQPRTQYRITVNANATDAAYALPLERDFVWTFIVAAQYPQFSILNRGRVLEFRAQENISIPIQFTNVSRLDVAVYPITQSEFDTNADAPFESWYTFQPTTAPLQQQRVATKAQLDQYTQTTLALEALPKGTFYLRISTPEGPSDAQLVRVE